MGKITVRLRIVPIQFDRLAVVRDGGIELSLATQRAS
jgi:hypothetical protein